MVENETVPAEIDCPAVGERKKRSHHIDDGNEDETLTDDSASSVRVETDSVQPGLRGGSIINSRAQGAVSVKQQATD